MKRYSARVITRFSRQGNNSKSKGDVREMALVLNISSYFELNGSFLALLLSYPWLCAFSLGWRYCPTDFAIISKKLLLFSLCWRSFFRWLKILKSRFTFNPGPSSLAVYVVLKLKFLITLISFFSFIMSPSMSLLLCGKQ